MNESEEKTTMIASLITAISPDCCFMTELNFSKDTCHIFCMAIVSTGANSPEGIPYGIITLKDLLSERYREKIEDIEPEENKTIVEEFTQTFVNNIEKMNAYEQRLVKNGCTKRGYIREYGYPGIAEDVVAMVSDLIAVFPTEFRMKKADTIEGHTIHDAVKLMKSMKGQENGKKEEN